MLQLPCTAQLARKHWAGPDWAVLAHSNRSLQLQKSVGTEPGFTLFLSSIQALSIRCAQQLFFFVFNGTTRDSISSITKLFLGYRSGKSTLLSRTIVACRVFHGKRSQCTWHVALEGSHYKPVKSPFSQR